MLKADGFDDAIIGFAHTWSSGGFVVVYDASVILDTLTSRDEMSYEEALEFFEFNIQGAFVGDNSPIYMWPSDSQGIDELAEHFNE